MTIVITASNEILSRLLSDIDHDIDVENVDWITIDDDFNVRVVR